LIPSPSLTTGQKPQAEVVVEGELSPFEDETLYRILRKSFDTKHPSYTEIHDEDLATRINVIFHYPYAKTLFTEVLQENWRDLKELFKQVSHRRGRAGAAFTLQFLAPENELVFKSGVLNEHEMASALDQIGHLTPIVGQMLRPEAVQEPMERIEAVFDKKGDRWHEFRGSGSGKNFVFDESAFRWVLVLKEQK
jgi:hypothetical protein